MGPFRAAFTLRPEAGTMGTDGNPATLAGDAVTCTRPLTLTRA